MIGALIFSLVVSTAEPPRTDYVPDTGWVNDQLATTFKERWFGRQLTAMGEPPLGSSRDLDGFRERFRFLVLPTFKPGYAYRVDVSRGGAMFLRWAVLSGRGGYAPGILAARGSRKLTRPEAEEFKSALAAASLPRLPREEAVVSTDSSGAQVIRVGADCTMFVFEHLTSRGREYLSRECGIDEPGLRGLAAFVFRLKPRERMKH